MASKIHMNSLSDRLTGFIVTPASPSGPTSTLWSAKTSKSWWKNSWTNNKKKKLKQASGLGCCFFFFFAAYISVSGPSPNKECHWSKNVCWDFCDAENQAGLLCICTKIQDSLQPVTYPVITCSPAYNSVELYLSSLLGYYYHYHYCYYH